MSSEEADRLAKYASLLSYAKKEQIPYDALAQEWGTSPASVHGIVGVLAKGGKVLDDLASVGYRVAELASWVGPTSAEVAQAGAQVPQGVPQGGGSGRSGGGLYPA